MNGRLCEAGGHGSADYFKQIWSSVFEMWRWLEPDAQPDNALDYVTRDGPMPATSLRPRSPPRRS